MDKAVTLAVAGAGKTATIVNRVALDKRALLITYTNNTQEDLRRRLITKFRHMPENVSVLTYFTFLNRFCYRPLLFHRVRDRGISFDAPSKYSNMRRLDDLRRYMDGYRRVYHCRIAKALDVLGCIPDLQRRVERYYDEVFVDEAQDFGGHDFDLLMKLSAAQVNWNLLGDFNQHTFATSHDGNVNKGLYKSLDRYRQELVKNGFVVDVESLRKSHRCSQTVCAFIRDQLGISIEAESERVSDVVIVETQAQADELHADPTILKLFLKEHDLYGCYSMNWGSSKGLDHHDDVCVVLNQKSWQQLQRGELHRAKPGIRNKLYVACSRPRRDLYLAPDSLFKRFEVQRTD